MRIRFASNGQPHAEQGSALALSLFCVTLVASAGAAYLQLTTSISRGQRAEVETTQAFYLAEAGLAEGFQAVRMGRTGQVGSATLPVRFGDGLLWVDAETIENGQVKLTATGLSGSGRAALSYVVQPSEMQLGIFASEEMIIDQVIMVDGYNSELGSYESQIPTDMDLPVPIPVAVSAQLALPWATGKPGGCHLGYHNWCTGVYAHDLTFGASFDTDFPLRNDGHEAAVESLRQQVDDMYTKAMVLALASEDEDLPIRPPVGMHTGEDGLLGSGQGITFEKQSDTYSEVFGNMSPGPGTELNKNQSAAVSGRVSNHTSGIKLPSVVIPNLPELAGVRHEGLLPMNIPTGQFAYESLIVAPDSELVIQGPATLVIGQLTLETGATLTLDTRAGDISLYVTGGMDLQAGSGTVTTAGQPKDLTVQVGPISSDDGEAPVYLDSTSQFFGSIYAPESEVYVGSDFELFGGIVARKLRFGPGARMHVDHAGTGGSSIPRIVSWQISEVPALVQMGGSDPYEILGLARGSALNIHEGHDLGNVQVSLTYVDKTGLTQSYTGSEDGLNWSDVDSVVEINRVPIRAGDTFGKVASDSSGVLPPPPSEPEGEIAGEEEPTGLPPGVRKPVNDLISGADTFGVDGFKGTLFVGFAKNRMPLSPEEWNLMGTVTDGLTPTLLAKLIQNDIDAGGTGGQ